MAKQFGHHSTKHEKIDSDNTKIVAAVGIAAFVVVFALFATKSLISQSLYQRRVIGQKEKALKQLKENKSAAEELKNVYQAFVSEPINVIGGDPKGKKPNDGDNAKIVLDALPDEYDYPGLASSIEKILTDGKYPIESVGGTEDVLLDSSQDSKSTIGIPYPFSINASPQATKDLLLTLEKSIRPMYVDTLTIRSSTQGLRTSIGVRTFYQPSVKFVLDSKEVR